MERDYIRDLLQSGKPGTSVTIAGWVRTRRDSKGFSFVEVNDGSSLKGIQVVAEAELENYESDVLEATTGASVTVNGTLVESPGKGQRVEVRAESFRLVGRASADDYPLQKKRHSNEFLRTIAHLRPRTNTFGAVFRVRHAASFAIHEFFNQRGFLYLHSPIITTSDCEGAGAMFRVSTLSASQPPRIGERATSGEESRDVDFSKDFFGAEASLTVSGQLEAET
ncbi:MAG: hypothetical protein KDD44_10890, partial [Bdellovibrionales bacterium]|nr:hypothetical protein [Bdellovibrionales bacterium]